MVAGARTVEHMFGSLERLAAERRELDAAEARWLSHVAEYDRSEEWRADGYASAAAALRDRCAMDHGTAYAAVTLARKLERLPATAAAFADGEISRRHAYVIADACTPARVEAFAEIEPALVDIARHVRPRDLRAAVQRLSDALDGDDGARADAARFERRRLHASPTLDGMVACDGMLDAEGGEIVLSALAASMEADRLPVEPRNAAQRRADGLVAICRAYLGLGDGTRAHVARPHVLLVADLAALDARSPGIAADIRVDAAHTGGVSRAMLERITCDCTISRVITDGRSEILDVGRGTRTVSPAQWKALVARDRHCRAPGCDRPPGWCQAHHIVHWARGGATDLANLELLCWFHHRQRHGDDARAHSRDGPEERAA